MKYILILICLLLNGFCLAKEPSLEDVVNGNILKTDYAVTKARLNFIRSLAVEYGLYYGRKNYLDRFNSSLDDYEDTLDEINFTYLLIGSNLLPPVIVEAEDYLEVLDSTHQQNIKKLFRVVSNAKLVTSVPTWRDYIFVAVQDAPPHLPGDFKFADKDEKKAWKGAAQNGIDAGVLHAKEEIANKYALLIRDYKGMLLAHHLNDLNILSFSKLERLSKGIIVEDKMVDIGDTTIVSSDSDIFNPADQWIPLIKDSDYEQSKTKTGIAFIKDSVLEGVR